MLDVPDYDVEKSRPNFVMTLHQFMSYFMEEGGTKCVEEIAAESELFTIKVLNIGTAWSEQTAAGPDQGPVVQN